MFSLLKNNIYKLKIFTIIFTSIITFYFWDFGAKYNINIDTRYLTFLPLLFFLNIESLKKKNLKIIIILNIYLLLQYFINFIINDRIFTFQDAKYYIAFIVITLFAFFCKEEILKYKLQITKFLLIICPLFLVGAEVSICDDKDRLWQCSLFNSNSKIFKLFFLENSHYAMVAISSLLLNIFWLLKKFSLLNLILILIFFFSLFIFQSTTLMMSMILITSVIFIAEYKRLDKKFLSTIFLILIIYFLIFVNIYGCSRKISDIAYQHYIYSENQMTKYNEELKAINSGDLYDSKFNDLQIFYYKNFIIFFKKNFVENYLEAKEIFESYSTAEEGKTQALYKVNISSQVAKNSLEIAIKSFQDRIYGFGLNRYQDAFIKYIEQQKENYSYDISQINRNDGSNNFSKLLTEFGIGSIAIFIYIFIFIFSKKISVENKIFLLPFAITQLLRGAGYFNGGFLLSIILIILLVHDKEKN